MHVSNSGIGIRACCTPSTGGLCPQCLGPAFRSIRAVGQSHFRGSSLVLLLTRRCTFTWTKQSFLIAGNESVLLSDSWRLLLRIMNQDTYRNLQTQTGVSDFWANKYARESHKNWDKFYKRNTTNFYKDRHWTVDEATDGFPCLSEQSSTRKVLVEAGCGVANCAFPLLESNPSLYIYAFDFAPTAVQLVKSSEQYSEDRLRAFVWDFCRSPIEDVSVDKRGELGESTAHLCTLVFVLSAVPPALQSTGLKRLYHLLKPGGRLLFRDYATGDMAQERFASRNKIRENYFVRQDSTLSFFFDEKLLRTLATGVGFEEVYVRRVNRTITNRKENLEMHRVFLQAEFVKPRDVVQTPSSEVRTALDPVG